MKISTALKTALPGQDPLVAMHIARHNTPGLFDAHDTRFEGNSKTLWDRATRELWRAWPNLGMRIRYIPGLTAAVRTAFKLSARSENWTLARLIDEYGIAVLPVLKKVECDRPYHLEPVRG